MNSIILIGDDNLSLDKIQAIDFEECSSMNRRGDSLVLEYNDGRIYFDYSEDIISDYEPDELEKIAIVKPKFISLAYTSKDVLKKAILKLNIFSFLMIDDDKGNIVNYTEYTINI